LFLALVLLLWLGIPKPYWIGVEKANSPASCLTLTGMSSVVLHSVWCWL
jgi:hypothetical protein